MELAEISTHAQRAHCNVKDKRAVRVTNLSLNMPAGTRLGLLFHSTYGVSTNNCSLFAFTVYLQKSL